MKDITLAESSELLRMSLPLMAKYIIPVTPQNYAVWYGYVAGDNFPLKMKMDGMLQKGGGIDNTLTKLLYNEYIDPSSDIDKSEAVNNSIDTIAESVSQTIIKATGDVTRYEKTLELYEKRISNDMKSEQIQLLVSELGELTKDMHKGNDVYLEELIEARKETTTLRRELKISREEAQTDALTELGNRKAFFDRIKSMRDMAANSAEPQNQCILIADIDKFKVINDTYGHLFGDKVIRIVAAILKKTTKGKDMAARFGGEEFIILLPDTDIKGAEVVAEAIRKNMEEGRIIKPKTGEEISKVTLSLGVTQFSLFEPIDDAIARADTALYKAKDLGRNRVVIAEDEVVNIHSSCA